MASKVVGTGARHVRPIFSLDSAEARRRVINLYKAWYRQVPYIVLRYDVTFSVKDGREKLRELFTRNKHVTDIRAIDLLVNKGQLELVETINIWKQKSHVMQYFNDTWNQKPTDFLSKFYDGHE